MRIKNKTQRYGNKCGQHVGFSTNKYHYIIMRTSSRLISDEILLTQLNQLAGSVRILPEQAAMILCVSVNTLKVRRVNGEPPRFIKEGATIRYLIEDIRDYLDNSVRFRSTFEALIHKKDEI